METGSVLDLYVPSAARSGITPHAIIALPRPTNVELLLCYDSQSNIMLSYLIIVKFFYYVHLHCYLTDEGVYVNSTGGPIKDTRLQWGEIPSSIGKPVMMTSWYVVFFTMLVSVYSALIGDSHVMGWGSKAIEIRAVENGQLDGVFMHKRTQKLRFLCEKNDKVWQEKHSNDQISFSLSHSSSPPSLFLQGFFASIRSSSNSQVYFMALNRRMVPQ